MNEKNGTGKLELGEYCGSFDFKSRTLEVIKVENPLTQQAMEENEKVNNVNQDSGEVIILSVRGGKGGNDHLLERNMSEEKVEVARSETCGSVKSESAHMMNSENEAKNMRKDVEKMEDDSAKSREAGVVVWVKEESTWPGLKQEVALKPKPVVSGKRKELGEGTCDDLVWCGELVWQESSSILPLINSCPCTVTGPREVVGMLPTRLTMRLITMRVVQSIQPELLRRCHRLELVPCHDQEKSGGHESLAMALSTMAGIVNQGDQGSVKKKYTGLFGNFSQHGGGVFPIPKTQNQKKVPLNHLKITQKTN